MARPTRVLIADDHVPLRHGVRLALERAGFAICAEVDSAERAVEAARRERPDVCLLDVRMPGGGLCAAAEIAGELPETAVVMLTVSAADRDLLTALQLGARGYLLKDVGPGQLGEALHAVLRGEVTLSAPLVARVVAELRSRSSGRRLVRDGGRLVELTAREWEVLDLLRQGYSTREVAGRLFLAPATVRNHVSSALRRLRVRSRDEALRLLERRDGRV